MRDEDQKEHTALGEVREDHTVIEIRGAKVKSLVSRFPTERTYKILLSPFLQEDIKSLSMGMTIYPPGSYNLPHNHPNAHEVWYVVSGEGEIVVGDQRAKLEPDVVIVAPPGKYHQIRNVGKDDLKVVWIFVPPGPEMEYKKWGIAEDL